MSVYHRLVPATALCLLLVGWASVSAQTLRTGYVPPTGARARAPYGGYGGYYPGGYYPTRAEGYMYGAAAVTNANAQYQVTTQEARQQQQKANQAQLETRRAAIEQWQYEQQFKPDAEKQRQEERQKALQRAMNFPPSSEIWSGSALNTLLRAIQSAQYHQVFGPPVPLRPDVLEHINLTDGTARGSVATLRTDKLSWPYSLQGKSWEEQRKKIDDGFAEANQQASSSGRVAPEVIGKLRSDVSAMLNEVDSEVDNMTPDDWIGAKRYLRELTDTIQTLMNPNVGNYLNGRWKAKGPTVRDLVGQMTQEGLTFAAASGTDRPSYTVLHNAMVTYNTGIQQVFASAAPPPKK